MVKSVKLNDDTAILLNRAKAKYFMDNLNIKSASDDDVIKKCIEVYINGR